MEAQSIFIIYIQQDAMLHSLFYLETALHVSGGTTTHHHHHISVTELGHLLTRSSLTYPEVSSKVCHDSFSHLGSSVSLPWVAIVEELELV
jgi:hypothetical protein